MTQVQRLEPSDWREGRRLRAWALHQQGWKQKDIAVALGVSPGAVSGANAVVMVAWNACGGTLRLEPSHACPQPNS